MDLIRVFAVNASGSVDFDALLNNNPGIHLIGGADTFASARQNLNILVPDIILCSPQEDGTEFESIQELGMLFPQSSIVILASHTDSDYVRDCLRSGAQDYLVLPIEAEVLQNEIENVYRRTMRRRHNETLSVLMNRFTGKPRVIGFISGKGGVGKTTIAVNTAVSLVNMGKKIALLDLDGDMGGTDVFLNLNPKYTLSDVVKQQHENLAESILDYLEWHDSGLAVLCAAKYGGEAENITAGVLRAVIQALQRNFQYVLVDLPPAIDGYFLSVVESAHECYMVSMPTLPVLTINRKLMKLFDSLGYELDKIVQVINGVGVKHGIKEKDVQHILKYPVGLSIGYDFTHVERSINQGVPIVVSHRNNPVSKGIQRLADRIARDDLKASDETADEDPK